MDKMALTQRRYVDTFPCQHRWSSTPATSTGKWYLWGVSFCSVTTLGIWRGNWKGRQIQNI